MVSHLFRKPRRLRSCLSHAPRIRQRPRAAPRAAGRVTKRAAQVARKVRSARARAVRWQRQRGVHWQRQRGVALVVALVVLAAVLALAVVAAMAAVSGERAARYERDHALALATAEAALYDAQRDIEGGADPRSARASFFNGAAGFVEGCGRAGGANAGLCADGGPQPAWVLVDLTDDSADAHSVAYGAFTGAALATGAGALPCCRPRYVIEPVAIAHAGESAGQAASHAYRITAIGFGAQRTTQVVLQAIYRRAAP